MGEVGSWEWGVGSVGLQVPPPSGHPILSALPAPLSPLLTTPILLLNKLLPQPVGMIEAPSALGRARAVEPHFRTFMSQHPSLRASSTTGTKRNVLKRFERVEVLKKRGQWKDGDRVTGLRKTKAAE